MKRQLKLILISGGALALLALPVYRSAAANPTNASGADKTEATMAALFGDPVIAKGKGFEIKRSELDEVMTGFRSAAAARNQIISPAQASLLQAQLLNRLIQVQLLLQKATAADKSNGVAQADLQISNLLARAGSQDALDRQLKAVGMSMAELRAKVGQESTAQAVLTRELNVSVSDAEKKQFYDEHPAEFERPELVHVRMILLMTVDPVTGAPLSADQQKAKQKQAEDILKRLRGGSDFAALAKEYSEDPASKENGGELPELARGRIPVPEFEAAAFSLTNNQISDVISSQVGYYIIKLLGKTPAKKMTLTDTIPSTDITIADRVKDILTQQKMEKAAPAYLDKLKAAADVQVLDPTLKATIATLAAEAATNAPAVEPGK